MNKFFMLFYCCVMNGSFYQSLLRSHESEFAAIVSSPQEVSSNHQCFFFRFFPGNNKVTLSSATYEMGQHDFSY